MKTKTILTVCAPFLSLIFCSSTLLAYTLSGSDWNYQPDPMGESVLVWDNTSDTADALNAVLNAMTTWNNAGAKFTFACGGNSDSAAPSYNGINQIRWEQRNDDFALATTTRWISKGSILEADIVINDRYQWATGDNIPSGSYDVESVALHELGHVLGLDHSNSPAVMQPSLSSATKRRTLTTDDINGLMAIYGSTICVDADLDGYFTSSACGNPVDCNDTDAAIYPGAIEVCNDFKDNDCDGFVDCNDQDCAGASVCNTLPDLTGEWIEATKNSNNTKGKLKVSNIGTKGISSTFYARVYLSSDAVLSGDDTSIKIFEISGLAAGSSTTLSVWTKKKGTYLIGFVDSTSVVGESDETNNITASLIAQ